MLCFVDLPREVFVVSCLRGCISAGDDPAIISLHTRRVLRYDWCMQIIGRAFTVAIICFALAAALQAQRRREPSSPEGLAFRFVGPVVGNRVASIAGVPGDPFTYYAGAASGGVWKTTDGGLRWDRVSDGMPV